MIYLDYAASTPVKKEVKQKLMSCLDIYGNPSSLHDAGAAAKKIITESKNIISKSINCNPDEINFTSGATMSNNTVLRGFRGTVVVSEIEHEDIHMLAQKFHYETLSVDEHGIVDPNSIRLKISYIRDWSEDEPILFSIQMANGEIGTIQNIKAISNVIHSYKNTYLHVDATQYIPYFKVDAQDLKIDALSMSGQKIGCIKGVGLLYVSSYLLPYITPLVYGKQGLVGGTENVIGIACLGEAFKYLNYDNAEMYRLRNMLMEQLNGELIGSPNRLPNNVCMCFEGVDAQSVVMLLNEYGVCCSSGSACSSGDPDPSHVLMALHLPPQKLNSCVRFTIGQETTEEEIVESIRKINMVVSMLKELENR